MFVIILLQQSKVFFSTDLEGIIQRLHASSS